MCTKCTRKWYEKLTDNGTIRPIVIRSGFFETHQCWCRDIFLRQRHLPRHRCQDILGYIVIQCSVKCLLHTWPASNDTANCYSFVLDAAKQQSTLTECTNPASSSCRWTVYTVMHETKSRYTLPVFTGRVHTGVILDTRPASIK